MVRKYYNRLLHGKYGKYAYYIENAFIALVYFTFALMVCITVSMLG